ncbi:MAG TPA: RNA polymerase sigma factor, partial [Chloroflexota bacterium]|nr:RNA polymerase sigma factor [Chloroflexota bacterium]
MSTQPRKPGEAGMEATPSPNALALARRAQAGDGAAYAELAEAHQLGLARFCRRLTGDAESGADLAQETLLRAQQSVGRLSEPYRFGPWLFGIAANLAKKLWRAEARRPLSLESLLSGYPHVPWDESHTVAPSPERRSEVAEELRLLADAIAALPPALSRVVVLHYLDGLNYAAVAGALDVPVSTVKGRLFESRSRLRDRLGDLREVHGPSTRTNGARARNGRNGTHSSNANKADNG